MRHQEIQDWQGRVHVIGVTVGDLVDLVKILKWAIILHNMTKKYITTANSWASMGSWSPIIHIGHVLPIDVHFPQSREVCFYDSNFWQAMQEAKVSHEQSSCLAIDLVVAGLTSARTWYWKLTSINLRYFWRISQFRIRNLKLLLRVHATVLLKGAFPFWW